MRAKQEGGVRTVKSWMLCAGGVVVCIGLAGCSIEEELGGRGPRSTGGASPVQGEFASEDARDVPPTLAGAGGGADQPVCGATLSFLPQHRLASPTFALAALAEGAWPVGADMAHLEPEEFLTYFSLPAAAVAYGTKGEVNDAGGTPLQVFADATTGPVAQHYVLVVDTSVSMRNDLGVAAALVTGFSATLSADSADMLTIVEWGTSPRSFDPGAAPTGADAAAIHTVGAADAAALGQAFADYLGTLDQAQLGPGGSLGTADTLVKSILKDGGPAPHVVVVTDGGLTPDSQTLGALAGWSKQQAIVSFVEVRSSASSLSTGFHADLLATLGRAGGGVTLFANDSTVADRAAELDRLLRPADVGTIPLLSGPFDTEAGTSNALMPVLAWTPANRTMHAPAIATCVTPPEVVTLTLSHPSLPSGSFDPSTTDARAVAVGYVLDVARAFRDGCDAALALPDLSTDPLCTGGITPHGYCSLPTVIDAMKAACQ